MNNRLRCFFLCCTCILAIISSLAVNKDLDNDTIKSISKPLLVRGDRYFPPYSYIDKDGNPTGFCVDLLKALAKETKFRYKLKLGRLYFCVERLDSSDVDIHLARIYDDKSANNLYVDMGLPVSYKIASNQSMGNLTLETLRSKNIVIKEGQYIEPFLIENGLGNNIINMDNTNDAIKSLVNDTTFVVVGEYRVLSRYIEKNQIRNVQLTTMPCPPLRIGFGLPSGSDSIQKNLIEGIVELKKSGTYDKLYTKWFGAEDNMLYHTNTPNYTLIGTCIMVFIALLMLLGFGFRREMRRRIKLIKSMKETEDGYKNSLDSFFESLEEGTLLYDMNGNLRIVNSRAVKILGIIDKKEFMANFPLLGSIGVLEESLQKKLIKREEFDEEIVLEYYKLTNKYKVSISKDGDTRIRLKYKLIHKLDGTLAAQVFYIEDLTNKIDKEEKFNALTQIPEVLNRECKIRVWVYDVKKDIFEYEIDKNNSYSRTFHGVRALLHADDMQMFSENVYSIIDGTETHNRCTVRMWEDNLGDYSTTNVYMQGQVNSHNEVVKVIGVTHYQDINSKGEIDLNSEILHFICDKENIRLWIYNLKTGESNAYDGDEELTTDILLKNVSQYIHPEYINKFFSEVTKLIEGEIDYSLIHIMARPSDSEPFREIKLVMKRLSDINRNTIAVIAYTKVEGK